MERKIIKLASMLAAWMIWVDITALVLMELNVYIGQIVSLSMIVGLLMYYLYSVVNHCIDKLHINEIVTNDYFSNEEQMLLKNTIDCNVQNCNQIVLYDDDSNFNTIIYDKLATGLWKLSINSTDQLLNEYVTDEDVSELALSYETSMHRMAAFN